jgi:hypothetical protein
MVGLEIIGDSGAGEGPRGHRLLSRRPDHWARRFAAALHVAGLAVATAVLADTAQATMNLRLQPHVAVYDLTLKQAAQRTGLVKVSGRLALELLGSDCEDWTINFRMVSRFFTDEDTVKLLDTQSSTLESADGNTINVTQRHFVDGKLDNESRVTATIGKGPVYGRIEMSDDQQAELANGAIFPVGHQKKIIRAALAGQVRDESTVFDGTEGTKTYTAISFLGAKREPGRQVTPLKTGDAAKLTAINAWPVNISYYDVAQGEQGEGTPTHEVDFEMYENGVVGNMVIDYGDYSLNAVLSKLEYRTAPDCPR